MNVEQIKVDIKKIEDSLVSDNFEEQKKVYQYFQGVYSKLFEEISDGLKPVVNRQDSLRNFEAAISGSGSYVTPREIPENYSFNLEVMKSKLYSSLPNPIERNPSLVVNVNSSNENNITAKIEINITFDDVKKQIDSMDSVLEQETINTIKNKIDELKSIIESKDKKSEKWKKAKDIGKWVFDKSVDVGIALLPLFLKIDQ